MTLNQLPAGSSAIIQALSNDNQALFRQCGTLGLVPGQVVKVLQRSKGKGPMQIKCRGTLFSIRSNEAESIRIGVDSNTHNLEANKA